MAIEIVNSREARARWRDLLDKILTRSADIVIERNGKPVAVMIPVEDYEEIQDELDDMRAARRAAEVYENWRRDPSTGRRYEDFRTELLADGNLDE